MRSKPVWPRRARITRKKKRSTASCLRLLQQYPSPAPTVGLLMERLAVNWVKLNRLERWNTQHQKSRVFARDVAAKRPDNSPASLLPDTQEGRTLPAPS